MFLFILADSPFHYMIVDVGGNDGYRYHIASFINNVADVFIFDTDNILTIHLQQVVIDQEAISCGWWVNRDGRDFSIFELKPNMTWRILNGDKDYISVRGLQPLCYLVQCQSSLKWSIPNC